MSEENQACEVPLIEQLRSVPKDFRAWYACQWNEEGRETGSTHIPVGVMMHRAADELAAALSKLEELERKLEEASNDSNRFA